MVSRVAKKKRSDRLRKKRTHYEAVFEGSKKQKEATEPTSDLARKKRPHSEEYQAAVEGSKKQKVATEPTWLTKQMKKLEGYGAHLIMEEKEIKATDLDTSQGRLLLHKNLDRGFLNEAESRTLDAKPIQGVSAVFIDTDKKRHRLELRKWSNGWVLTKGWSKVIQTKKFEVGEKYPLWSFRSRKKNDKLCFALVPNTEDFFCSLPTGLTDTEESENERDAEPPSSSRYPPESTLSPGHNSDDSLSEYKYLPTEEEIESYDTLPTNPPSTDSNVSSDSDTC